MMVKSGPFRPFGDEDTQAFLRDITDGFFPHEFKDEYPDGVLITAHDRRFEAFGDAFEAFSGQGRALGQRVKTLSDMGSTHYTFNPDDLLRKLPEKTIKNGQVIAIRSRIKERLGVLPE